jgi:hypothetical protein
VPLLPWFQPPGLPPTGKRLRRGFGLLFVAIGALALALTPTGVAVFVHGLPAPLLPLALSVTAIGLVLYLAALILSLSPCSRPRSRQPCG